MKRRILTLQEPREGSAGAGGTGLKMEYEMEKTKLT